jgi:hypothetical protein
MAVRIGSKEHRHNNAVDEPRKGENAAQDSGQNRKDHEERNSNGKGVLGSRWIIAEFLSSNRVAYV